MSKGDSGTRQQRRHAGRLEQRARRSGMWGIWEETALPHGIPGADPKGWCVQVRSVAKNDLYVVLMRPIETAWGIAHHLAIRTASSAEPPWRDKQRIKNELFGPEWCAVEVMPPASEIVDDADMYHLWVFADARCLPFTLPR